jgi:hypothetical protein
MVDWRERTSEGVFDGEMGRRDWSGIDETDWAVKDASGDGLPKREQGESDAGKVGLDARGLAGSGDNRRRKAASRCCWEVIGVEETR